MLIMSVDKELRTFEAMMADCPRCGNTHSLVFTKFFGKPEGESTHWASCARHGEPVLARAEQQYTAQK